MEERNTKEEFFKENDKIIFLTHYEIIFTKDEFMKKIDEIKGNIKVIETDILTMDTEKAIVKKEKELNGILAINKESLRNFSKYISEEVIRIKNEKMNKFKEIQTFVNNFEKFKSNQIAKIRINKAHERAQAKARLEQQKEALSVYLKYKNDVTQG